MKEDPHLAELLTSDHSENSDHPNAALKVNRRWTRKNTSPSQLAILLALKYAEKSLDFCDWGLGLRSAIFILAFIYYYIWPLCYLNETYCLFTLQCCRWVFLQENFAKVSCWFNAVSRLSRTRPLFFFLILLVRLIETIHLSILACAVPSPKRSQAHSFVIHRKFISSVGKNTTGLLSSSSASGITA